MMNGPTKTPQEGDGRFDLQELRPIIQLLAKVAECDGSLEEKRGQLLTRLSDEVGADVWWWSVLSKHQARTLPQCALSPGPGLSVADFEAYVDVIQHAELNHVGNARCADDRDDRVRSTTSAAGVVAIPSQILTPAILSFFPTNDGRICGVTFLRAERSDLFLQRHIRMVKMVLSEVGWLHSDSVECTGDEGTPHLSPRMQGVLTYMLEGMGRKQIADQLKISVNTLNGYVKDLYRVFDVHSQPELICRCTDMSAQSAAESSVQFSSGSLDRIRSAG